MLSISGVTKRYGKTLANDNISFAVGDGQIGILLGPNGAGKSTIIKCITGLLRFTGRIEINGYENTSLEAKAQLGYIPEMPAVYDLLTVEEHLEFIRRAYKVEDEAYTNQLLERLELDDKRNKLGKELSKEVFSQPLISMRPVNRSSPVMHLMMVDFPAPLGPSRMPICPSPTAKLMLSLARVLP